MYFDGSDRDKNEGNGDTSQEKFHIPRDLSETLTEKQNLLPDLTPKKKGFKVLNLKPS